MSKASKSKHNDCVRVRPRRYSSENCIEVQKADDRNQPSNRKHPPIVIIVAEKRESHHGKTFAVVYFECRLSESFVEHESVGNP
ncbi:hypothetical protein BD410DRAFT_797624 [Rickenella mellea]|uniref:Uncharacterized protein n=1 Tax=Rickenella mellea TaxID=50990 RepID=A0A4Y7PDX1_9AGAM|nr:hypothetical protein BD410DRAFT_797624 [Rickenella mellea]